ncbi:MAG: hypothetical protein CK426_06215 [Legionella sp.]|nr:MAG: hypothetical protein CK423_02435 [Legionella sp.]PJD98485.1 MAG: hypothetical protein CK426_06215 [Legionella sp.]
MPKVQNKKEKPQYQYVVCAFQGGGALGAYQAGVLHALDKAHYFPNWFVGTSIGAINAAIAAGNPEHLRIEKMYQFWEKIATHAPLSALSWPDYLPVKKVAHWLSAHSAALFGQAGFFSPRLFYPGLNTPSADNISFYDMMPLRSTLEQFVDFDRINSKKTVRLSVGAVEVESGEMLYFDSEKEKIGPEHIMASGALPPSFPAIEINGKYYWDGGISNNSPLCYVLSHREKTHILCFMVNLFNSYGLNPQSLDDVLQRKKDIEFSSKFHQTLSLYQEIQELKNSIHLLSQHIPPSKKEKPELKLCLARGRQSTISLVHFLYQEDNSELSSKDYEFSYHTIKERLDKGYKDGMRAIKKSPWLNPIDARNGIALHDMSIERPMKRKTHE